MHRKAYACGIAYCSSLAHITVCRECEEDMYRVHNGTMVSHFIKRHMGYDVCTMYNNIILDHSCGYMCMYLHVRAVKGGCTENQAVIWKLGELPKVYSFIYTMCECA